MLVSFNRPKGRQTSLHQAAHQHNSHGGQGCTSELPSGWCLTTHHHMVSQIMSFHCIQLTNWILWNGKFYYQDVIKITISRVKGEVNGHFYHIEVIDLPFHTIPFVSCFISLIENTKKLTFIENLQANLG